MRWSRLRSSGFLVLLLTVSACSSGSSTTTASPIEPGPSGALCTETDVGSDPPATITIIASTVLDVPFQSWECPGFAADSFSTPADARLTYDRPSFDVVFESAGELTITGSSSGVPDERLELDWQEQSPVRVTVSLRAGGEVWQIAVRLVTSDGRTARYVFMLEPQS